MPGGWQVLDAFATSKGVRVGTPGPRQTLRSDSTTFHRTGDARDYGRESDAAAVSRLYAPIARSHPELIPEVFGIDGVGVDDGRAYQAPGHTGDHTHIAIGAGVTAAQLQAAAVGGPVPAGEPVPAGAGAGGGGPVAAVLDVAKGALRRYLMVVAGVALIAWGLGLLGIDLGAVGAVANLHPAVATVTSKVGK